jgi:PAS domain S-box-containing protein
MYRHAYLAECNDALAKMYGYSRADEIVGARLGDLMPIDKPENVAYLRAFIRAGYRLKDAASVELDQSGHERRFRNNLVGILEGGKILRGWGTQRDVTEAERLLTRYQLLQAHSRDIILLVNGDSGRLLDANVAAEAAYGYTREELLALTVFDLRAPNTVPPVEEHLRSAREHGILIETEQLRKDGRVIPVEVSARGVVIDGENILLAIIRDITTRRAAEEELQRRIEFEKQIVGIVSHDLKNPLATILLQAGGALRLPGLDERTQKMLARIQRAAERGSRMVSDLLDFTQARLGGAIPIESRSLHLGEVVRQTLEELRPLFAGRRIDLAAEGDLEGVWDGERLGQVVSNLASNALKYSPPETVVRVRVIGEGGSVVLEIHNEGEPIPEQRLPSVFEPLQRAVPGIDKAGRSVGLGLYIVNQVVRAHGGSVDVVSTKSLGTTFTVRLPRVARASGSEAGPERL